MTFGLSEKLIKDDDVILDQIKLKMRNHDLLLMISVNDASEVAIEIVRRAITVLKLHVLMFLSLMAHVEVYIGQTALPLD